MRVLNLTQLYFLEEVFFKYDERDDSPNFSKNCSFILNYNGIRNMILIGSVVAPCCCVWETNIGDYITVSDVDGFPDYKRYEFNLDEFTKTDYYKDKRDVYIRKISISKATLIKESNNLSLIK